MRKGDIVRLNPYSIGRYSMSTSNCKPETSSGMS